MMKDVDFEEEGEIVTIPEVGERIKDEGFWLVGKIHTKESSNVMKEFKTTIAQALKKKKGVEIRNLERNLLAFRFLSVNDKEAVIKGCPRNFDRRLIVLNDLMHNRNPNKVDLP